MDDRASVKNLLEDSRIVEGPEDIFGDVFDQVDLNSVFESEYSAPAEWKHFNQWRQLSLRIRQIIFSWTDARDHEGKRLIISYSEKMAQKDRADRKRLVDQVLKLEDDGEIATLPQKESCRNLTKYRITPTPELAQL